MNIRKLMLLCGIYCVSAAFRPNILFVFISSRIKFLAINPRAPWGLFLFAHFFFAQNSLFPLAARGVCRKRVGSIKHHAWRALGRKSADTRYWCFPMWREKKYFRPAFAPVFVAFYFVKIYFFSWNFINSGKLIP